jgi:hypothetical protein
MLYLLHKHGPRLEGTPPPTVCSSTNTGLGQLETHIRAMLLGMGGTTLLPQGLPPPSLHVTSLSDTMSASVMDGACMSVAAYALSSVAHEPDKFSWVARAALPEAVAVQQHLRGEQASDTSD